MNKVEKVLKRLEGLTSAQIAEYLSHRGIKGDVNRPASCPIANLIKKTGVKRSVQVEHDEIFVDGYRPVENPINIVNFIENFDQLKYPNLVKE